MSQSDNLNLGSSLWSLKIKSNNPLSADVIGGGIQPRVKQSETLGLVITKIKAIGDSDRNGQVECFCRPLHGLARLLASDPALTHGALCCRPLHGLKSKYFFVTFNFQRTLRTAQGKKLVLSRQRQLK
jgi:hypothetical protein